MRDRAHVMLRPFEGLFALIDLPEFVVARVARLEEMGGYRADQRHIGGIEPDDAVIAFVDVAVPHHRRGQDQVARLHLATPAVDDGDCTLRARGETDRRAGMTVRAGARARGGHGGGGAQRARGGPFLAPGPLRPDQLAAVAVLYPHLTHGAPPPPA